MRKKKMAVCDANEQYVYRLQEILLQRESFPFEVEVYTSLEMLCEQWRKRDFAMILVSEEFSEALLQYAEGEGKEGKERIVILRERRKEGSEQKQIRKFQSAIAIRQEIMQIAADMEQSRAQEEAATGHKRTELIGIFSPVNRDLQTSFSLLMGQFLARKKSVLYLNLEPFSGLAGMLECKGERDLTDLIYYLESGRERLVYKLESVVSNSNGLDYVSAAYSFVDLSSVKEENWRLLIRTLKEMGNYDYIVLDLSEIVQGLLNILRECDEIYTIGNKEAMSSLRLEQYEELLHHLEYEDVLEKTQKIILPPYRRLPIGIADLLMSDLGYYVKDLVGEMLQ